jgi:hypothetical protein
VAALWVYVYGVVTVPFVVSNHVVAPPQAFLGLCAASTLLLTALSRLYTLLSLVAVVAIGALLALCACRGCLSG